jgi:hypothetical protein
MNGNVFQCYKVQNNRRQSAKTVEPLEGYIKKTLQYSEDIAPLFAKPMAILPTVAMPEDLADNAGATLKMIFAEEVMEYVKRSRTLKSNIATTHAVIWGQCSKDMKSRIKTHTSYKDKTADNNVYLAFEKDQVHHLTVQ